MLAAMRLLALLFISVGVVPIFACGSDEGTEGHAGSGGTGGAVEASAGTGGTGGGSVESPCPDDQPKDGDACETDEGTSCSFGTSIQPACRVTGKCEGGAWTITVPTCEPQGAGCPPDSHPSDGVLCSDTTAYCSYLSGWICRCSLEASSAHWKCATPPEDPHCPATAPNEGTLCNVNETTECRYGTCETEGPYVVTCAGNLWTWKLEPCAS